MPHKKSYQMLEHTADLAILSYGRTLPELFINTALAMMDYLFGEEALFPPESALESEKITIESKDLESLLVDWLSEFLLLSATKKRIYGNYKIHELSPTRLHATIEGAPAQALRDIKAVTFHNLTIQEKDGRWEAQVTYDI